ncbi:MAG: VCBS repeat-containing protein [Acidobacteriota bacterium]
MLALLLVLAFAWGLDAERLDAQSDPFAEPSGNNDATRDLGSLEPPDGQWLKGDDGREYFVTTLPKGAPRTEVRDDGRLRYKHWFLFDLVREDDDFYYVKVFKPAEIARTRAEVEAERQQRLDEIAATYVAEGGVVDKVRFTRFSEGLPESGRWRNGFDLKDINGDGHLDILHGPLRKGSPIPRIVLGDSAGNWTLWRDVKYPRAPYEYGDAAGGDFDGDGLMDLAMGWHLRGLYALRQTEPGVFAAAAQGLDLEIPGAGGSAEGFSSRTIEVGDWNGDGLEDIIAVGEGPRPVGQKGNNQVGAIESTAYGLVVYLSQGDGTWQRLDEGEKREGTFGDDVEIGDFNNDGKLDAVISSHTLGRKDVLYLGKGDEGWDLQELPTLRPRAYIQGVAVGDFNRDGLTDIATTYVSWEMKVWRSGMDVHLASEDGEWTRRAIVVKDGRANQWALTAGDLDENGTLDLVGLTERGEYVIYLGDGAGGFDVEQSPELRGPLGCRGYQVKIANIDGKPGAEFVAAFAGDKEIRPLPMQTGPECDSGGAIAAWSTEPVVKP